MVVASPFYYGEVATRGGGLDAQLTLDFPVLQQKVKVTKNFSDTQRFLDSERYQLMREVLNRIKENRPYTILELPWESTREDSGDLWLREHYTFFHKAIFVALPGTTLPVQSKDWLWASDLTSEDLRYGTRLFLGSVSHSNGLTEEKIGRLKEYRIRGKSYMFWRID